MLKKIIITLILFVLTCVFFISCGTCSIEKLQYDSNISLSSLSETPDVETPDVEPPEFDTPNLDIGEDIVLNIGDGRTYWGNGYIYTQNSYLLSFSEQYNRIQLYYTTHYRTLNNYYQDLIGLNSVTLDWNGGLVYQNDSSFNIAFQRGTSPSNQLVNINCVGVRYFSTTQGFNNISSCNLVVNYIYRNSSDQLINAVRLENVTYNGDTYVTNYVIGNLYIYFDLYETYSTSAVSYNFPYFIDLGAIKSEYYDIGYQGGAMYGYKLGYDDGYQLGYDDGYQLGYSNGVDGALEENPLKVVSAFVNDLLSIEIFPGFKVGFLVTFGVGLTLLLLLLKVFR